MKQVRGSSRRPGEARWLRAATVAVLIAAGVWAAVASRRPPSARPIRAGWAYLSAEDVDDPLARARELGLARVIQLVAPQEGQPLAQSPRDGLVRLAVDDSLPSEEVIEEFIYQLRRVAGPVLVHAPGRENQAALLAACYRVIAQGWSPVKAGRWLRREAPDLGELRLRMARRRLAEMADRRDAWLRRTDPDHLLV